MIVAFSDILIISLSYISILNLDLNKILFTYLYKTKTLMNSSTVVNRQCTTCKKSSGIFIWGGCNEAFCPRHVNDRHSSSN